MGLCHGPRGPRLLDEKAVFCLRTGSELSIGMMCFRSTCPSVLSCLCFLDKLLVGPAVVCLVLRIPVVEAQAVSHWTASQKILPLVPKQNWYWDPRKNSQKINKNDIFMGSVFPEIVFLCEQVV